MTALYGVPAWLLLIVADAVAAGLACAGLLLVRRALPKLDFVQHNEVAGFIVAIVGTLYAVMLAFVIAIVWQEYDGTQSRAYAEAAAATDVWHLAQGLSEPLRGDVRTGIVDYARTLVDDEWPQMQHGGTSARTEAILTRLITGVARAPASDAGAATVHGEVLRHLTDVHDMRRYRIADNRNGVSWFEWTVLAVGAGVVIGFCYVFGMRNDRPLMLMTAGVAVMIVSLWVLVFELDYPFRGELSVSSAPWQQFLDRVASP